jgi:hypothetical protein
MVVSENLYGLVERLWCNKSAAVKTLLHGKRLEMYHISSETVKISSE